MTADPYERETIVTTNDGEPGVWKIYTCQPKVGRLLERIAAKLGVCVIKTARTWEATLPESSVRLRAGKARAVADPAKVEALRSRLAEARRKRWASGEQH